MYWTIQGRSPLFHFFYILPSPRHHVINSNIVLKVRLEYFGLLTVLTILVIPVYADQIVEPTDKRTINIGFSTDPTNPKPGDQTQLKVSFINKQNTIQQHIDYKISVTQGGNQIFGIPLTHTAEGSVSIPFQFQNNGTYQVTVRSEEHTSELQSRQYLVCRLLLEKKKKKKKNYMNKSA